MESTPATLPVWAPAKWMKAIVPVSSMTLLRWAKAGKIQSRKIEAPGNPSEKKSGGKTKRNSSTRLYNVASVLAYIEASPSENPAKEGALA